MSEYNIKISGSGTVKEITESLQDIINAIIEASESEHEVAILDCAIWEDDTLMTKIWAK